MVQAPPTGQNVPKGSLTGAFLAGAAGIAHSLCCEMRLVGPRTRLGLPVGALALPHTRYAAAWGRIQGCCWGRIELQDDGRLRGSGMGKELCLRIRSAMSRCRCSYRVSLLRVCHCVRSWLIHIDIRIPSINVTGPRNPVCHLARGCSITTTLGA